MIGVRRFATPRNCLRTIDPDKQAIALIHAIEVGVTEMLARRARLQRKD